MEPAEIMKILLLWRHLPHMVSEDDRRIIRDLCAAWEAAQSGPEWRARTDRLKRNLAAFREADPLFRQLPAETQRLFWEWKPEEFLVFWPLIQEQLAESTGDDPPDSEL